MPTAKTLIVPTAQDDHGRQAPRWLRPARRPKPPTEPTGPAAARPVAPRTTRERDVVRLVARDRTNEEVAGKLYVTLATVKPHLGNVQRKLSARNRVEIAAWAWESGLCTEG